MVVVHLINDLIGEGIVSHVDLLRYVHDIIDRLIVV
jgi:hypothetical protein